MMTARRGFFTSAVATAHTSRPARSHTRNKGHKGGGEAKAASAKAHKTSGQEVYMREEVQQILQMLYLYKN